MLLIADTTVISNFALVDGLDLLFDLKEVCTTEQVFEELKAGIQRGVLETDLSDLGSKILRLKNTETNTFFRFSERFGQGEASCLAIAFHRNSGILTDDLDARKFAQKGGIPVSGSIGVLVKSVENGQLSLERGNELLQRMIHKGFFSPVEALDQFLV